MLPLVDAGGAWRSPKGGLTLSRALSLPHESKSTMPSQLSTAASILSRGVFDGLTSFEELEQRVSRLGEENTKVLGDAFEIFVEAFLATQPKFMAEEVWLVGQVPLAVRQEMNLPNDTKGIDGIFRTRTGALVPYQVKFRSKRAYLTYTEVAPFLGLTERAKDRIIFTNSNEIAVDAKNRDAMRSVRGGDFDDLTPDDFRAIECWLKEKPFALPKPQPRDYQIEALDAICGTLETHDRATAVMACGTGKTLLALWVTERLKPKTVLVLVPSLTLLQQTLDEWSRNNSWGRSFSYLCVCSDPSVAQGNSNDSIELHAMDVEFSVDTDPSQVRKFLERDTHDVKVVFSTYQSCNVVIEGCYGLHPFDIAIFDEAHKTTGPKDGLFARCLSDANINVSKRLFLTATPRHYDIRHRDKEGDFKVVSMDDQAVYGPRAYTLTFGAAAKRGIICDYKVIISVVDGQEISQFALNNGITVVDGDLIGAKWVANQIAIERAVQETGAVRVITFHSRVSSAAAFSSDSTRGVKQFLPDFDTFHVSGSQKSSERKQLIKAFRDAPKAIVTNARCLTEGIDIPAVDMVAFIDPRQSRVDIAQATGRAMRKIRGSDKTTGYVVIPLFVDRGSNQTIEEALNSSNFSEINSVLNAMKEQDDDLTNIIKEMNEAKGRGDLLKSEEINKKIDVIGPEINLSILRQNIFVQIAESLGSTWDQWFGRLSRFRTIEGHCKVPQHFQEGGYNLGQWVSSQRARNHELTRDRIDRLNSLDFIWDTRTRRWEDLFQLLLLFREREGHCRVPDFHVEDNCNLGTWVLTQRANENKLSSHRKSRLNSINFVWDAKDAQWESAFKLLEQFQSREGHCLVPQKQCEDGFMLGAWVNNQRNAQKNKSENLSKERVHRLNSIGFIWTPLIDQWEKGFEYLVQFHTRNGHCVVAAKHVEGAFNLGNWVHHQRALKQSLMQDKIEQLNSLGFIWDPIQLRWEEGFSLLLQFSRREGHCRVEREHLEKGYKLGNWVARQRNKKNKLTVEDIARLNSLGFIWDSLNYQWEEGFNRLLQYKEREGHCLVPALHIENCYQLGQWVGSQRRRKTVIEKSRVERLNSIGFIWDPNADQWEIGFRSLMGFYAREGHCLVPKKHTEDGYALGGWVGNQRYNKRISKKTLTSDRIERLNAIGFTWHSRDLY